MSKTDEDLKREAQEALTKGIQTYDVEVVTNALEMGANPNGAATDIYTPLQLIAQKFPKTDKDLEIISLLLGAKADPNRKDLYKIPLMALAQHIDWYNKNGDKTRLPGSSGNSKEVVDKYLEDHKEAMRLLCAKTYPLYIKTVIDTYPEILPQECVDASRRPPTAGKRKNKKKTNKRRKTTKRRRTLKKF
jgi:hypothetical protein